MQWAKKPSHATVPLSPVPGQLAECAAKARLPPYVLPQSLQSSSAAVLKQLSAAVPKQLLLLGRLLVSSAAEEQEERQLRVPPAVAVLTAAAPAAVVVASCFSKMDTFDKKYIFNRSMLRRGVHCRQTQKNFREHFRYKQSKKMCAKTV